MESPKNNEEEYAEADIFLYWSELDVMPLVFLEAMAFGILIITNNFPAFQEILLKECCSAKNTKEYTTSLNTLIENYKKRKCLGETHSINTRKYLISKIIEEWYVLY